MKKMLKSAAVLTAFVTIFVLCALVLPNSTQAATYNDLSYVIVDDYAVIVDCNEEVTGELIIPNTIEGYPVTAIGNDAFYSCGSLTAVKIPDGIISVGARTFQFCSNLTSINIPDSVIEIGDDAFWGCDDLTGIWVDENNSYYSCDSNGVLYNKDQTILLYAGFLDLNSYDVPNGVTTIGDSAFQYCEEITAISLPDSLQVIEAEGFASCSGLKTIIIPEGVTAVGVGAFAHCNLLEDVSLPSTLRTLERSAFEDCDSLTEIVIPDGVTDIPEGCFAYCENLRSVLLSDGVINIGNNAFCDCPKLESIVIPDSVQSIGDGAFRSCDSLSAVTMGGSVKHIGKSSFYWCVNLSSINIPSGIESIGDDAFGACADLNYTVTDDAYYIGNPENPYLVLVKNASSYEENLYVPSDTRIICSNAFEKCTYLEQISIPDSVVQIGDNAFNGCTGLRKAVLGRGISALPLQLFQGCTSLMQVNIPGSVSVIGDGAFYGCSGLTSVYIPSGVTTIGHSAFEFCSGLTSITIPSSVKTISDYAFRGCSGLISVVINEGVTYIGDRAFDSCTNVTTINIPDSVEFFGDDVLPVNMYNQLSFTIEDEAYYLGNANNPYVVLVNVVDENRSLKEFTVNPRTKHIYSNAFKLCYYLERVTLPDGLLSIGNSAFEDTAITEISVPDSVLRIGAGAFNCCFDLSSVTLGSKVQTIGERAFYNCTHLERINIPESVKKIGSSCFEDCIRLKSIIIPDGVTEIESDTFYGCRNLTDVVLFQNITLIDDAFENCNKLQNIYYTGTYQQWEKIDLDYAVYSCLNTLTIHTQCRNTSIQIQPADQFIPVGNTAEFTVDARGTMLSYQWQYRESIESPWCAMANLNNIENALQVLVSDGIDGHQYRCVITNIFGDVVYSDAATLNVITFKVIKQPVDGYAAVDKTVKFSFAAEGQKMKYQWQYRTSAAGIWKVASATGNKTTTMRVPATVARNGYQYRCQIEDQYGNILYTNVVELNVFYIKSQPANKFVPTGKSAKFTVKASGTGLKYQWQYRTSAKGSWKNTTATGYKTATLSVSATAARNGYQYRCKIADKYGNVIYSNAATLKIVALKVTTQPANKYLPAGKTAKFTVNASGTGLKYQWQYRTSAKGSWKIASATGNKTATLSVPATAARNGYQYRCKITDKYGNVIYSNAATLKIVTLKITTQPSSVTLAKGKTATFKVVAKGTGLKYQWQYRKNAKGAWKKATNTGNKTATLKVPVTAARNGYQYRCVITDKYGNVINSNAATLKVKK